ncbi:MAG: hypothetical protein OEY67_00960 [Gammaproteobacteria bacterium]|nr:hypothetical protein [Gammaproteobacteria bacterium]
MYDENQVQGSKQLAKIFWFMKWLYIAIGVVIGVSYLLGANGINPVGLIAYIPFILIAYLLEKGAKNEKLWAKDGAFVFGVLLLLVFPIGTIFGVLIIRNCTLWKRELQAENSL